MSHLCACLGVISNMKKKSFPNNEAQHPCSLGESLDFMNRLKTELKRGSFRSASTPPTLNSFRRFTCTDENVSFSATSAEVFPLLRSRSASFVLRTTSSSHSLIQHKESSLHGVNAIESLKTRTISCIAFCGRYCLIRDRLCCWLILNLRRNNDIREWFGEWMKAVAQKWLSHLTIHKTDLSDSERSNERE